MLFGVPPHDPGTYDVVALTIALVCLIACWRPALQASCVNPIAILRDV